MPTGAVVRYKGVPFFAAFFFCPVSKLAMFLCLGDAVPEGGGQPSGSHILRVFGYWGGLGLQLAFHIALKFRDFGPVLGPNYGLNKSSHPLDHRATLGNFLRGGVVFRLMSGGV